jgi:membrane-associated protease RseP (regulator of RpoE activity)
MNWDSISLIIFYSIILLFYYFNKEKFDVQGKIFFLYKTKLGISLMKKLARFSPRIMRLFWSVGVVVGFVGLVFMTGFLIKASWDLIFVPGTESALAPVLPGVNIPGAPALSFWHWIICLFLVAVVHEFAHGVVSKLYKVRIKSSGFAFLGPILAAFVEPDENKLKEKSKWKQLSILAAGPFANLVLGGLVFLFLTFVFAPILAGMYDSTGIFVYGAQEGYPVNESGIELPFVITSVNGDEVLTVVEFMNFSFESGDEVLLGTDKGDYAITLVDNPDNSSKGYFGMIGISQDSELKENYQYFSGFENVIQWVLLLLIWLFLINIGVGFFNLLPLGPVDGGRMFHILALVIFKDEKKATKIFNYMSLFVLGLIVINLIPWIEKFFYWIVSIGAFLVALV